jgi:LacI family transcriptional regulator, galactose operon repressor
VRCPEDVALATFDDLAGDRAFHPKLTVIAQPGYEIGACGATLLMDRIEGKLTRKPSVVRVAPTLIVRESTRSQLVFEKTSLMRNSDPSQRTAVQGRRKA